MKIIVINNKLLERSKIYNKRWIGRKYSYFYSKMLLYRTVTICIDKSMIRDVNNIAIFCFRSKGPLVQSEYTRLLRVIYE